MQVTLRVFIFVLGTIFTLTVVRLLIKKSISERNSLLWLLGTAVIFILSIYPKIIDKIAYAIGVEYPPTLLFLLGIIILLFITLFHSIQISILNSQVKELTQYIAINNFLAKEFLETRDAISNACAEVNKDGK
jgi:hypothetical protein